MSRRFLFATALSGVSALALPVFAQQAVPPGQATEVIITAQKRTERLRDVPVAAQVVSSTQLATEDIQQISDINKLVPSVDLNGSINGRVPFGVRGISTVVGEGTVGLSSGVAVMIDGVPVPSDSDAANQLDDVERIEVLKGPQATLGGRTASAGVINIVTHAPKSIWSGFTDATITNDGEKRWDGFVTGPIAPSWSFSLFGDAGELKFPINNLLLRKQTMQDNDEVRGKLRYTPNALFDATLTLHGGEYHSRGANFVYRYITPGATLLFPGSPLTQPFLLHHITPSPNNQDYSSPVDNTGMVLHDVDATLEANYHLGGYTITSTTAFQRELQRDDQDLFLVDSYFWQDLTGGAAPPFYNYFATNENIHQTSEELKLVSPADSQLSFVSGIFASNTVVGERVSRALVPALEEIAIDSKTSTIDAYGRATYKLTPQWSLLAGLRVNEDLLGYRDNQAAYTPYGAFSSKNSHDVATVVGDVTLQDKYTPSGMIYATYSRGYAPEAFNTAAVLASNAPLTPVGAESVDDFEIGSKTAWLGNRLYLDLDAFYTLYHNYQVETFESLPGYLSPPTVLVDAAGAETRGVELNGTANLTSSLTANLNAAYLDARFTNFDNALCYGGQTAAQGCVLNPTTGVSTQNVSGKPMPNAPHYKFDLGATQTFLLPNAPFDLVLDGNYSYRSKAEMLPDENPEAVQAAYGIFDLGVSLRAQHWSLRFFVNNVLNQHYDVDVEDFFSSVWSSENAVIGEPAQDSNRYFGGQVSANF